MKAFPRKTLPLLGGFLAVAVLSGPVVAQLLDRTKTPNPANEGIAKSFEQQIGSGRGSVNTPDSSLFIIARDPFRSVRRGRQIFQRKFTHQQGLGPRTGDGQGGDVTADQSIGAGLTDSCAACHNTPRGSAGAGGQIIIRPDNRNAPHLFGLGLKEMLGDEITTDLRNARAFACSEARRRGVTVRIALNSKGINYGNILCDRNGNVNTSEVRGVNTDLRVRPLFQEGATISIREFLVGAFNAEMGLEAPDPDMIASEAAGGARVVTPSGMVLDGRTDAIEQPAVRTALEDSDNDGVVNEIPVSIVDHMEFYLLHYFKAGLGSQAPTEVQQGRATFMSLGCGTCHIPDLTINRDRRVADVNTVFDSTQGVFNRLFATATPSFTATDDGSGHPTLKRPNLGSFVVRNIFTDFKRHDLGPNFHERLFNGTIHREFLTLALWGAGTTAPYGHDGRSINLREVILRHGGEAQAARDRFAALNFQQQANVQWFINSLILFPPDDTASNLQPGVPTTVGFPQFGHGSIRLGALFNNPLDPE